MWAFLLERLENHWRALVGTFSLHGIVYAIVLFTPFRIESRAPTIVPVVLVERPALREEEPIPPVAPGDQEVETTDTEVSTVDTPEPPTEVPTSKPLPDAEVSLSETSRPPAPTVEPSVANEEEPEAIIIDPRYEIPFDSFAETAPSALARVTVSTMCARASLATRPDFCPEISIEDRYFSAATDPSARGGYDPRGDIVAAQSTIENAAAAPLSRGINLGIVTLKRSARLPKHAEALPCAPVQTGLQGPAAIETDLEAALGSTDGIQCR